MDDQQMGAKILDQSQQMRADEDCRSGGGTLENALLHRSDAARIQPP